MQLEPVEARHPVTHGPGEGADKGVGQDGVALDEGAQVGTLQSRALAERPQRRGELQRLEAIDAVKHQVHGATSAVLGTSSCGDGIDGALGGGSCAARTLQRHVGHAASHASHGAGVEDVDTLPKHLDVYGDVEEGEGLER